MQHLRCFHKSKENLALKGRLSNSATITKQTKVQTLGWRRDIIIKKPEELYNAVHACIVMNIMYDLLNCLAQQLRS